MLIGTRKVVFGRCSGEPKEQIGLAFGVMLFRESLELARAVAALSFGDIERVISLLD